MITLLQMLLGVFLWLLFWLGPFCGMLWLGYYLLSIRMRRQERARFFLDLVEAGMKQGRRIEDTIISVAASRDTSMGARFHLLAAYIEKGLSFRDAMDKLPRVLPPQIAAMLRAGLQIGDVGKVMPACRQLGKDAVSQTRGAINYLVLVAFVGFPTNLVIFTVMQIYVLPQFISILEGMGAPSAGGAIRFLVQYRGLMLSVQALLCVIVWAAALVYVGGSFFGRLGDAFPAISHGLAYRLPWRRKRLQRDFSAMLAILLDAGVPEPEAVTLAADCTSNHYFRRRAQQAVAALQQGTKLPDAIQLIDDSGEFRWRLVNALQGRGGFLNSIAGWNESLDAKAFQQEQATAQAVTTGLVLINGAIVGVIVVSVFSALIAIINAVDLS